MIAQGINPSAILWTAALLTGYPSRLWHEKLIVVLQAYVDDSRMKSADKRLFLVGYIHRATDWAVFSDAWDAVLRAEPAIAYFSNKEAINRRGPFKGWSECDRNSKMEALAQVIAQFRPWSVDCSISCKDFAEIVAPRASWGMHTPYFFCFRQFIHAVAHIHGQYGVKLPVDFIFDEQGEAGREAVFSYNHLKSQRDPATRKLLGATPVFRDDEEVKPLQAADMLAWFIRRDHEADMEMRAPHVFEILKTGGPNFRVSITRDQLVELASAQSTERPPITRSEWRKMKERIRELNAQGIDPFTTLKE